MYVVRAVAVAALAFAAACSPPNGDRPRHPEAYPVEPAPFEGAWQLHALDGAPARAVLWLTIEGTRFQLEGCGTLRGSLPAANGPRPFHADTSSPSCPQAAWSQHQQLVRLIQLAPTPALVDHVEGCRGRALELTAGGRIAVFCPPLPTE
jgi:hypothetical protein